jgi:hypothetical protein
VERDGEDEDEDERLDDDDDEVWVCAGCNTRRTRGFKGKYR